MKLKTVLIIGSILFGIAYVLIQINKQTGTYRIPLYSNQSSNQVRVKFINDSDLTIQQIHFKEGTTKSTSVKNILTGTLQPGEEKVYSYENPGEGSYHFEVEFQNGKRLISAPNYVEGGYYTIESIKNHKIETKF